MGDNVRTLAPGGVTLPRSEEDAALLGAAVEHPAVGEAAAIEGRQRKMFDNPVDKAISFSEAVVDGFLLGLAPVERGPNADMRREVTAPYVAGGEGVGAVLGLVVGGPVRAVSGIGEGAGKLLAKEVLRRGEKSIVTTALKEAGAGAAITGATSFNHQLLDTIIEDRPFSGEAILDDAKLGGVVGLVGGGIMGGFGKLKATRGEVSAQGGFAGGVDDALGAHEAARAAHGEALHFHETQLGVLKQWRQKGLLGDVSDDFIRVRSSAVSRAREAQARLRDMDVKAALSGSDPALYKQFQRHWDEYSRAMDDVDDIMRPHPAEASAVQAAREPGTTVRQAPVRPVQGGEDFAVPASRVGEAIPDEAGYLARYKESSPPKVVEGSPAAAVPEGTIGGRPANVTPQSPAPSPGLAELDEAIKRLPLRSGRENGELFAVGMDRVGTSAARYNARQAELVRAELAPTQVDAVPYGAVAKQMDRTAVDALPAGKVKAPKVSDKTAVDAVPEGKLAGAIDDAAAKERTHVATHKPREVKDALPDTSDFEVHQRLMDDWLEMAEPRVRPLEQARARAQAAMEELYQKAGGRFDSARGLGILEADGIAPSANSIGSYFDSVYSMNRATRFVADEARGVATPLRDALKDAMGSRLLGAVVGKIFGGSTGAALGFIGYGGRLAAATGRLALRVAESVGSFMTSTKIRGLAVVAANRPWAYSDKGPIEDPVERIQEIQFLASNPDAIRARVREQAGDLAVAAPEHIRALEDRAVGQIQALAIRAPAIYWDRLGRPLTPPQGKLRQFHEFENATNDLGAVLDALKSGAITGPQIEALQISWPAVHTRIVQGLLSDPAALQKFPREKLRVIEQVTGVSLTGARDPMFMARQQQGWAPTAPPTPPQEAQAFKLQEPPTPAQANATGRAPGN
jgi:hypothetical protein